MRCISALIAHRDPQVLNWLQAALLDKKVMARWAGTCRDAGALLVENAADVIFAGVSFSDGSWREVLRLAKQSNPSARMVIFTTGLEDIRLCLESTAAGAADVYVVPPFADRDVAYIVHSAIQDVIDGTLGGPPAENAVVCP